MLVQGFSSSFWNVFVFVWFCSFFCSSDAFNVTLEEGGALSTFLYEQVLEFPDFSFTFLGVKVEVTDLSCFHMLAVGLYGRYVEISEPYNPNQPQMNVLNITAYNMNIQCSAYWSYRIDSGTMNMTIGNDTEISLRLKVSDQTEARKLENLSDLTAPGSLLHALVDTRLELINCTVDPR